MSTPGQAFEPGHRAVGIVAIGTILAILYFGRDVLVPITLAIILSLLLSPFVRVLRRVGVGSTASVLVTVLLLMLCVGSLAAVMGVHMARMAASLPQYEDTIHDKLATLDDITVERFNTVSAQVGRLFGAHTEVHPAAPAAHALRHAGGAAPAAPIPVELHAPPASAVQVVQRVLGTVWVPLETTLIVLVVLVFVLLEQEAVRDRFIRIVGGTDLRATTLALNDAGERLSRFFVSQFLVNLGVGIAIWVGLLVIGVPHALLWGALASALRFVPYVGVWIAALFSALLACAVEPGWALAVETLGLFLIVELIAGQLIEPRLYGHATGLSPLSVVIAAIFWSWLWGPVGLILSTPLTLCLVVAGRHVKALALLDVLFGDTRALTLSQSFYQRALAGDSREIVESARAYLRDKSFAAYCDLVLVPALYLASLDLARGVISEDQQVKVRATIVSVIEALESGRNGARPRRRTRISVLDQSSAGRLLRQRRELTSGPWQGPLVVAPGSVVLCVSLGTLADDLATELLVRILRDQKLDARHVSNDELVQLPPPDASPDAVALAFLVSAYPSEPRRAAEAVAGEIRRRLPRAGLVTVFFPGVLLQSGSGIDTIPQADRAAASFIDAVQVALDWMERHARREAAVAG